MSKIFGWLIIVLFLISGCTFNVDVLTPAPPSTPFPTQTATPIATISPTADAFTPTPTPAAPVFYGAAFIPDSGTSQYGRIFSAGTKQVFVVWNYLNMSPGMVVRREWYLNGQLWLTREEPWDFAKYSGNGSTQQDVSIYDFDIGLPTGIYELRMYIDNVIQPIGDAVNGQPETKATFQIRSSDEAHAGNVSPDFQWAVEVFSGQRIVLEDKNGNPTTIYTAREVPYVTWFPDSRHFLFVDRDRSGQMPGTTLGIRDDLWLVEVPHGTMHLLYKGETAFAGYSGPVPSPDGKYIASLEGSGYGDACAIDTQLLILELNSDFIATNVIKQQDFAGLPMFGDSMVYPANQGYWQTNNLYQVTLAATCDSDQSKLGPYTFNMATLTATQSSTTQGPIPGDLGVGMVHGKITDVITGAPISNASITCEHHSYTSSQLCSGTVLTNQNGEYAFNNVFFHDTDTIEVTVQASGYETITVGWNLFTINDMKADVELHRTP